MTHPRHDIACRPAWTCEQIRAARMVELAPLLMRRGLALRDRGGGNVEVELYEGLLLKASYWRWPERDLAGNAIDFYVKVLGLSFSDAMKEITQVETMPESARPAAPVAALRSERGYSAAKLDGRSAIRPSVA